MQDAIFKDAPPEVNSAVVNRSGDVTWYECYKNNIRLVWSDDSDRVITDAEPIMTDIVVDTEFEHTVVVGRMKTYRFEIWASTSTVSSLTKEVFEYEFDHVPTDEDMNELYDDYIGNIMDSGIALLEDEE